MPNTTWSTSDLTGITLSGSNLTATVNNNASGGIRSASLQASGKQYWEYTATSFTGANSGVGVANSSALLSVMPTSPTNACLAYQPSGAIWLNNANTGSSIGAISSGSVVGVALDMTGRLIWFRIAPSGNWNGSGTANPATGTGGISVSSIFGAQSAYAAFGSSTATGNGNAATANFGDAAFTGAVPSGFAAGFSVVPTTANVTQALAEHWLTTNPDAQITQVVAEHWASVTSGNLQAVVTQVMLEHWASVAVVVPAAGGPMVTMIH